MSTLQKTFSVRLSDEYFKAIENIRDTKGLSSNSEVIRHLLEQPSPTMAKGGQVVEKIELPEELKPVIAMAGGGLAGVMTYKILKTYLPKDRFTNDDIETFASIAAIAVGLLGMVGIGKLMDNE